MSKKVYELASMLGITNNQMIDILWGNDINVENHMSIVDNKFEKKIMKEFSFDFDFMTHKNRSTLKYINIIGLFYKHDYKITFDDDINLFIAENGFGKTTILNIIVSTLKGDRNKLKSLPFKKLIIKLEQEVIEISKEELNYSVLSGSRAEKILLKIEDLVPANIWSNLYKKFKIKREIELDEIKYILKRNVNNSYYRHSNRNVLEETKEILWYISDFESEKDITADNKLSKIRELIKEEVLYFPTYRRIEEELDHFVEVSREEKRKLSSSSINFGMEDVEKVINELTDKLKEDAINNYSIMNGEILDDLLTNELKLTNKEKIKIDKEKIKIVIGRIGENRIKKLDKLMDFVINDLEVANKNFLEYYLFKLINIYENQKPIDDKIKKYRDICNGYLVNKEIVYDEVTTEVKIEDKENRNKIYFKDLSSGEKQILSLFCKLYLNTSKQVIFIIDEPELSLSILWQKQLIKDIYDSGRILLLIATTHSPYIFKNEYRVFAKEINIFEEKSRNDK